MRIATDVPTGRSKDRDYEPLARGRRNYATMDEHVVQPALFGQEGYRGVGARRELAGSEATACGTHQHSSILLGGLYRRWRLALIALFAREL